MQPATCPKCGQPVLWIASSAGGLLCLDPEPNPKTGTVVVLDGVGVVLRGDSIEAFFPAAERRTQHLQTCAKGKSNG